MKSNHRQELLIVFTRYPEPGTTKTRLIKTLGPRGAAAIQKKLTEQTMLQVRKFLQSRAADVIVCHEGGSPDQMQNWLGPDFQYQHQGKGDLGQRMQKAFAAAFNQQYRRIVIIGADCPALRADCLVQAFQALHHREIVLGPAADGGYYLIGLSRNVKEIFKNVPWSTAAVLKKTLTIAEKNGLSSALLATLSDVDIPEDLNHFNYYSDM
jgi:rSAM/selenodomain-associated transferase 1